MATGRKRVNRQITLVCGTLEEWIDALSMNKPIKASEIFNEFPSPSDEIVQHALTLHNLLRLTRREARWWGGPRRPPPRWK